jgi:hypothetical protein
MSVGLLKGIGDIFHWTGQNWPENRFSLISLWGEV